MYTSFVLLALSALSATAAPQSPSQRGATPPTTGQKVIYPNGNTAKCLSAASNSDGAAVVIQDCVKTNTPASQLWTVQGNTFRIFGNKCLDDTNGSKTNGQKMQIYTCGSGNKNQQWSQNGGSIQLSGTNKCLDNTNGSTKNGTPAQIWDCTGGPNQKWTVANAGGGPTPPSGNRLRPGKSASTCVTATSNSNGAAVVVRPCDNSTGQSWNYTGGSFVIFGNKCLDVTNGSTKNGNKMQIYTCNKGNANQQFVRTPARQIIWKNRNECLDLTNGSLNPGNPVQMWQCSNGNPNQVWNFA